MYGKITKADIVAWAVAVIGDKRLAKKAVDKLISQLSYCLYLGYDVEIRGFGTFKTVYKKGMANRRNPKTGETIEGVKPDRLDIKFKASNTLLKEIEI